MAFHNLPEHGDVYQAIGAPMPTGPFPVDAPANNLRKNDKKQYYFHTLVVIDATEAHPVVGYDLNDPVHKRLCHKIENVYRDIVGADIAKICLPAHATEATFLQAVNVQLHGKTERDMITWYFHGSGGGIDTGSRARTQGGPHGGFHIYKLLAMIFAARPDSLILWDGPIHDKSAFFPRSTTGNVEIITLGGRLTNPNGTVIHEHDSYLSESLYRTLQRHYNTLTNLPEAAARRRGKGITIPEVWKLDYEVKNRTKRIYPLRFRGRHVNRLRLIFRIDPVLSRQQDRLVFYAYCNGPKPAANNGQAQNQGQVHGAANGNQGPAALPNAANGAAAGAGALPGVGNAANAGGPGAGNGAAVGVGAQPGLGHGLGVGAALGLAHGLGAILGAGGPAAAGNGAGAGVAALGGGVNAGGVGAGALAGAAPAAQNAPAVGSAVNGNGDDDNGLFVNQ